MLKHQEIVVNNDDLLSKTISYLRFPLTVLVVFIHFSLHSGLDIRGHIYGLDNPDWFFFIVTFISQILARISVPLFYVISGFLFFYHCDFNTLTFRHKLKSRIKSLFIPYLVWNVIAIIWTLKCFLPVVSNFFRPVELQISFCRIINTFICNSNNSGIFIRVPASSSTSVFPINEPLWYLRDLMFMVLLTPIIYWLLKKLNFLFPILLFLTWFLWELFFPNVVYMPMFVTALFFFSWGGYFSVHNKNIVIAFRKFWCFPFIYFISAIIDTFTFGMNCNAIIHNLNIMIGVISAVNIVSWLIEKGRVKEHHTLSNASFFIYVFHGLFIADFGKILFISLSIPENNPYAMLAFYFFVPTFCIIICLMIYLLLRKYSPKSIFVGLTGGR